LDKLKVLVVDDSVVYRRIITSAVQMTGKGEVDCVASSGITALERLEQRQIDVVLLDVFMEGLDGIQTLKRIKIKYPHIAVIMISGGGEDSVQITVKALEMGAMDFILKPSAGNPEQNIKTISRQLGILFSQILVDRYTKKIRLTDVDEVNETAGNEIVTQAASRGQTEFFHNSTEKDGKPAPSFTEADVVVIASSTGGPAALENVCSHFDETLNKPVLVVQHMPPEFTRIFAQSLGRKCLVPVKEAEDGERIKGGIIYIAPGGFHLTVINDKDDKGVRIARLEVAAMVNGVRPSADVLFSSIASSYKGQRVLAVILTGMGSDGKEGVVRLKEACHCYCITQSEKTCTVYGMPRSVYEAGLSDEVADLDNIGLRIMEFAAIGR